MQAMQQSEAKAMATAMERAAHSQPGGSKAKIVTSVPRMMNKAEAFRLRETELHIWQMAVDVGSHVTYPVP